MADPKQPPLHQTTMSHLLALLRRCSSSGAVIATHISLTGHDHSCDSQPSVSCVTGRPVSSVSAVQSMTFAAFECENTQFGSDGCENMFAKTPRKMCLLAAKAPKQVPLAEWCVNSSWDTSLAGNTILASWGSLGQAATYSNCAMLCNRALFASTRPVITWKAWLSHDKVWRRTRGALVVLELINSLQLRTTPARRGLWRTGEVRLCECVSTPDEREVGIRAVGGQGKRDLPVSTFDSLSIGPVHWKICVLPQRVFTDLHIVWFVETRQDFSLEMSQGTERRDSWHKRHVIDVPGTTSARECH